MSIARLRLLPTAFAAAALAAACGGSDSPAPATTTVSGSVVKGPVSGATVCAYKATAGGKGEQIKCATTGAGGSYSLDLQYSGDVVVEASGGTYTDEATGATKTLSDPMQVVVSSQGGNVTGMVTPLTSVAYSLSKSLGGGVTSSNFGTAASNVAAQFQLGSGVNIATTAPALGSGANSYGKALQGVSKFVANGGTLSGFIAWTDPNGLQASYTVAYNAANGGSTTFSFSGTASNGSTVTGTGSVGSGGTGTVTVSGTGAGGGSATCAVAVNGSVTASGFSVPVNYKFCVRGLQTADQCSSGNASLSQAITSQQGLSGAANLTYTYGTDCTGSQFDINLK